MPYSSTGKTKKKLEKVLKKLKEEDKIQDMKDTIRELKAKKSLRRKGNSVE